MKTLLIALCCLAGCALTANEYDATGAELSVSTDTAASIVDTDFCAVPVPETSYCAMDEDGNWICDEDPSGGGGGGGGPIFTCSATCDPTWGGQDWYCTTSCGRPARCYSRYRCSCPPWDYSEECLNAHIGYCN